MTPLSVTFYNTLRMQSEYTSHAKRLSISRSCQIDIDSPSKNSLNRSEIITLLPDECSNQFIEDLSFLFGYHYFVPSPSKNTITDAIDVVLVFLLLTLNICHI